MIENAAVFVGKGRRFKGVNVEFDGEHVLILDRARGTEQARYKVVETAKADMAWDVEDSGTTRRLVAQQGCGCSGMKPYKVDDGYSGALG